MQRSRRVDPYPWTWEVPTAVALALVFVLVVGVHVGRAMANLLAGTGWLWPESSELFRSLWAVLAGDSSAGLSVSAGAATSFASAHETWLWVVLTELVLLIVSTMALLVVLRRWGPGRMRGMATSAEAMQLLGARRLRRHRRIVRPDKYGPGRAA